MYSYKNKKNLLFMENGNHSKITQPADKTHLFSLKEHRLNH
jgi:hypothetical protein